MKIEKLVIYGFGKHQDKEIVLNSELSMIYGTNEAGKTTLQQFIVQTLFGYPAKTQNLRRYEPKNGGKYGGQLHISAPDFGRVIIERVKGKASGDVTLYFEDGSRGSEAELKAILRDYDRSSFESVFSFSIHELQGLEKMSEEELSRTLLASGTTGMDAVAQMESRLEKSMGTVFKKGGRTPAINMLVDELKLLESVLKEYRGRIEQYEPYMKRIREVDNRLINMSEEESDIDNAMKSAERWLQAEPLFEKSKALEQEANTMVASNLPADGRRRMDRLADRLSETAAQIELLEQQSRSTEQLETMKDVTELEELLVKESGWHQLRTKLASNQQEIAKNTDEQNRLLSFVGVGLEEALQAEVTLHNEERLLAHVEQADREEEEQRFHSRKLAEEKVKLEEASKELKFFLAGEPTETERKAAEDWLAAAPKLAEAKAAGQLQSAGKPKNLRMVLIALGVLGALFGLWQGNYPLLIIAGAAIIAGGWMFINSRESAVLPEGYQQVLATYSGREVEFNTLIEKLAQYDRKLDNLLDQMELTKRRIASLTSSQQEGSAKEAYQVFLKELGIYSEIGRKTVMELFNTLRGIQALQAIIQRLENDCDRLAHEIEEWRGAAVSACGKPLMADGLYEAIRAEFSARNAYNANIGRALERNEKLMGDLERYKTLAVQIEQEQGMLLKSANATNLEQFYHLCDEEERLQEIYKEQNFLQAQLKGIGEISKDPGITKYSVSVQIEDFNARLMDLKKERHDLLAEKAHKQQITKMLLSDGEYEDKLQQFEEKKVELAELAKQWSVDKAITAAIRQTMDELKDKKLPAVIRTAKLFFRKLTDSSYSGLEMNPQGFFEAVREDGMRFHMAELSQATKEQAYVSLRLALAVSMRGSHPFPIIMDDPFVHFDRSRLQHMINLITELQPNHQFIYFTCHESMKENWPNAAMIDVADIERSVHS